MQNHRTRYILIWSATIGAMLSLAYVSMHNAPEAVLTALGGALAILVPSLVDAHAVEKRRLTPGVKAVEDDVPALQVPNTLD